MQRRNTLLGASALLLTATCSFSPKVDPSQLDCKDDNGCPSGYRCVGVTVGRLGFCCNKPETAACFAPTMTIDERVTGTLSTPATPVTNLYMMVGVWHTYRFSIVTTGSDVALKGYLDGVLKVSAADAPATFANGTVAIGVRSGTADFDNLIVTTP